MDEHREIHFLWPMAQVSGGQTRNLLLHPGVLSIDEVPSFPTWKTKLRSGKWWRWMDMDEDGWRWIKMVGFWRLNEVEWFYHWLTYSWINFVILISAISHLHRMKRWAQASPGCRPWRHMGHTFLSSLKCIEYNTERYWKILKDTESNHMWW